MKGGQVQKVDWKEEKMKREITKKERIKNRSK